MSVTGPFYGTSSPFPAAPPAIEARTKRPAPFSLRLTAEERTRLVAEAAGAPLGSYIKAKVIGTPPVRLRRGGLPIADRQSLARALALLGQSRLSSNLNQLAHLANIGALPVDPQTQAELNAALSEVHELRTLLLRALGLKPDVPAPLQPAEVP